MTTEQTNTPATVPGQVVNLQRCYLKGLSVETPHAPQIFLEQGEIAMDLNLTIETSPLDTNVFNVLVRGTLTANLNNKVVYLIEAEQAGVFQIAGFDEATLHRVLNVMCPSILYPYMRAQIADTIARTTLPVFHLPEVAWEQMYQTSLQAQALAQAPVSSPVQ